MPAVVREGRFNTFQSGEVLALSCTDLTSRGLDTVKYAARKVEEFPNVNANITRIIAAHALKENERLINKANNVD
ncbi:ATP-dependent RNA helicase DDX28-like [Homarus americanus]|uniref:ATP-dependent RNA helicase DDX28-like n=1 Tax=Homarus americanus TaxID=6706 RepID=A0A8J5TLP7_HOMAM|nr:ATP-dependent RNA helicase DDX28-like [Homarus americanus]